MDKNYVDILVWVFFRRENGMFMLDKSKSMFMLDKSKLDKFMLDKSYGWENGMLFRKVLK